MTVAVITGGRDRIPTISELELVLVKLRTRHATIARHGGCRSGPLEGARRGGTDLAVAAYLKARAPDIEVQEWPAEDFGAWPACGPKRNRGMLDGAPARAAVASAQSGLFGESEQATAPPSWTDPAKSLITLRGGVGTANCTSSAIERGLPVDWIPTAVEPRPWNRHHGRAPDPSLYIGRGQLLGNPWALEPGEDRQAAADRILGRYRRWLWARINPGPEFDPKMVELLDSISDQHHLVCSCWPLPCHAEVVIGAWRWRRLCALVGEHEARELLKGRGITPAQALAELEGKNTQPAPVEPSPPP